MLKIENLEGYYDLFKVIHGVDLHVDKGEIVAILGGNGAGKTTVLRFISGLIKPAAGKISFNDDRIDDIPPHKIVERGIIQIPEGRKLFPSLTVLENLYLGSYTRRAKVKRTETLKRVYELFPVLQKRRNQLAGTLSGGEMQMLAIGRGLMALPEILMLDEPSLGLSPILIKTVFDTTTRINSEGTTVLLVEQNVHLSLQISDRGYVLENGVIVLEGESEKLGQDEKVMKSYLGM